MHSIDDQDTRSYSESVKTYEYNIGDSKAIYSREPGFNSESATDTDSHIENGQKNQWRKSEEEDIGQSYAFSGPVGVFDVAAYVLRKLGSMTTMKLQKLVYYCQAWSLVWDEKPLFAERIEAWANGPVIRELFNYHQGSFTINSMPLGNPDILNEQQKETIDAVLDFYGDKTAQWLIELSHSEYPWKKTRGSMPAFERGSKVIPLDMIADYYSSIRSEE